MGCREKEAGCGDSGGMDRQGEAVPPWTGGFQTSPTVFPLVVFASGHWDIVDTGVGQLE